MDRKELIAICDALADDMNVTEEEAINAELVTKKQSKWKE